MARIAIIDDVIHENHLLTPRVVKRYRLRGQRFYEVQETLQDGYTHGTLVAKVLEQYAVNYEIISVQLHDNLLEETALSVDTLVVALKFCLELDVDIISVSLGSEKLSEIRMMTETLDALHCRGIPIVAAYSNDMFKTIPAAYDSVVGVRADSSNSLSDGRYGIELDPYLGTSFIARYSLPGCNKGQPPCNSLAVPVIAAQINRLINQHHRNSPKITEQLISQADFRVQENGKWRPVHRNRIEDKAAIIYFVNIFTCDVDKQVHLLDAFAENGFEAVGLNCAVPSSDVRLITLPLLNNAVIQESHAKLSACTQSDILIVFVSSSEFSLIDTECDFVVCPAFSMMHKSDAPHRHMVETADSNDVNEICQLVLHKFAT